MHTSELNNIILNNSSAVRTPLLPEVQKVVDEAPRQLQPKHYESDILSWLKPVVDLSDFYVYPMNGITEGLNWWMHQEKRAILARPGDYQWVSTDKGNSITDGVVAYVSTPSAVDGDFKQIPTDVPVVLDLAYVGTASGKQQIQIPDNVERVFYSLSKSFGLWGARIGWMFTRKPDSKLDQLIYEAKYYNTIAHQIGENIIDKFPIDWCYEQFEDRQYTICNQLKLFPSDSVLLATSYDPLYSKFYRPGVKASIARISLTNIYKALL